MATKYFFVNLLTGIFEIIFLAKIFNPNLFRNVISNSVICDVLEYVCLNLGIVCSIYYLTLFFIFFALFFDSALKTSKVKKENKKEYKKTIKARRKYKGVFVWCYLRMIVFQIILLCLLALCVAIHSAPTFAVFFLFFLYDLFLGSRLISEYFSSDIFVLNTYSSFPEKYNKNCKFCLIDNNECFLDSNKRIYLVKRDDRFIEFKLTISKFYFMRLEILETYCNEMKEETKKILNDKKDEKTIKDCSEILSNIDDVIKNIEEVAIGYKA